MACHAQLYFYRLLFSYPLVIGVYALATLRIALQCHICRDEYQTQQGKPTRQSPRYSFIPALKLPKLFARFLPTYLFRSSHNGIVRMYCAIWKGLSIPNAGYMSPAGPVPILGHLRQAHSMKSSQRVNVADAPGTASAFLLSIDVQPHRGSRKRPSCQICQTFR